MVVKQKDWRRTEWAIPFSAVTFWIISLSMTETYKKKILNNGVWKFGIPPRRSPHQSTLEAILSFLSGATHSHAMYEIDRCAFQHLRCLQLRAIEFVLRGLSVRFYDQYGLDIGSIGLTFLGLAAGPIAGLIIIICIGAYIYTTQVPRLRGAKVPPEQRSYIAIIGAICLPTSLFWFG